MTKYLYTGVLTSLDAVRQAKPKAIYYATRSCWWTHRETDLQTYATPDGHLVPCDPRGGLLFEACGAAEVERFLRAAEQKADHYGIWGLTAFLAAHNDNCVMKTEMGYAPWCFENWDDYNKLLDEEYGQQRVPPPTPHSNQETRPIVGPRQRKESC